MPSRRDFTAACLLFMMCGLGHAERRPFPVVLVRCSLAGASPEGVEAVLTSAIERSLVSLERVIDIHSTTSDGTGHVIVEVTIRFVDGANEEDLALVKKRIEQLPMSPDIRATTISVQLGT